MPVLFLDSVFCQHDTGDYHPESPRRLEHLYASLRDTELQQRFAVRECSPATRAQLERVHAPAYIDSVQQFSEAGGGRIEVDTVLDRSSYDVAVRAAGTAVAAVEEVITGQHRRAMCLVRPPGHHARPAAAMGFCLFNNVAVAARHATAVHGLSRVLIVDWDVHHGNGTQESFYESPDVYFLSAHRSPFYPGTGSADETGSGAGLGATFNLPLAFGVSWHEYRVRFATLLEDAASRCQPELVLISAGFDAHRSDPIGSLGLESEDFGQLTEMVIAVAEQYAQGRLVSVLEGGYNLEALASSVECHLEQLANPKP